MKKTLSILLSLCFVASLNTGAFAVTKTATATKKVAKVVAKPAVKPAEVSAKGAVKNFTDKTITVVVNGKDVTYKIASTTKVIQNDAPVAFLDAVQKGVYVTFKYMNTTNTITSITIPNAGAYGQGDVKMKLVDINVAQTDSNLGVSAPKVNAAFFVKSESQVREAAGTEKTDAYIYGNDGTKDTATLESDVVVLGAIEAIDSSVKVTLDGKELKVITGVSRVTDDGAKSPTYTSGKISTTDAAVIFDSKAANDECMVVSDDDYGVTLIKFEKNLYEDEKQFTEENLNSRLKVAYEKKIYKITTYQITEFPLSDDVVCELNGKSASLAKVLNKSNYSLVTTNLAGEIIFINGFYKDMYVRVDSVKGNTLTFSRMGIETDPTSLVKFTDTVTLSDGITIQETTGAPLELSSLAKNDIVKITTEQEDGFRVTLIEKLIKK